MKLKNKLISIFIFLLATELLIGVWTIFAGDRNVMNMEMKKLFPLKIGIYQSDGKDEFYDRKTTFRYMDGAAEIYRSYGFKLLLVRHYSKTDNPPIIVEVFDMGSSEDAFGIFSYETEDEEVGVGQGSDFGGGLLRFWKGRFFFNVYPEKEGPLMEKDVLELGNAIADSIKQEGQKPKLINHIPKEGLIERSIHYFYHSHILNHHYFLSHENILQLDKRTNALLASYSFQSEGKFFLLLIQYPSQTLAKEGLQSFIKAYMPESSSSKATQTENGKWTVAQVYKKYVTIVFDSASREKAEALILATHKNLEEKKS
jgi:hypothetical protein